MATKYWKHILWVLLIKSVLLSAMWYAFFRDPPKLDDQKTSAHVFLNH